MIFIEPAKVYVERQAAQEREFNKLMATFRSQENDRMNHDPLDYVILNHLRELGGAITLWGMLNHLGALNQTKRRDERREFKRLLQKRVSVLAKKREIQRWGRRPVWLFCPSMKPTDLPDPQI